MRKKAIPGALDAWRELYRPADALPAEPEQNTGDSPMKKIVSNPDFARLPYDTQRHIRDTVQGATNNPRPLRYIVGGNFQVTTGQPHHYDPKTHTLAIQGLPENIFATVTGDIVNIRAMGNGPFPVEAVGRSMGHHGEALKRFSIPGVKVESDYDDNDGQGGGGF